MTDYIQPDLVTSPMDHWKLEEVVRYGEEGEGAWAIGTWDDEPVLAFRWNGTMKRPKGNPVSTGYPTWVVMERCDYPVLLNLFDVKCRKKIAEFLDI